ncbi:MAG: DUF2911 domain-containing protein [Thermoanaerobaculia bacterium]
MLSRKMTGGVFATSMLIASLAVPLHAELQMPRPSPKASVSQTVGVTDVTITYSRPGVKDRVIWGGLVPYGKVWRTGANEATTITFSSDVKVEGQPLKAGRYALFTIPTESTWTLIFNKDADQWGAYDYDPAKDVLRVEVQPKQHDFHERMTFAFPAVDDDSATVALAWEKLIVPFRVEVDTKDQVLSQARHELSDWQTPYRAASFSYHNGGDAAETAAWLDRSIAIDENFYNVGLKARILAESGKPKDAVALGEKAVKLGKAATPPVDTSAMEEAIAGWKK